MVGGQQWLRTVQMHIYVTAKSSKMETAECFKAHQGGCRDANHCPSSSLARKRDAVKNHIRQNRPCPATESCSPDYCSIPGKKRATRSDHSEEAHCESCTIQQGAIQHQPLVVVPVAGPLRRPGQLEETGMGHQAQGEPGRHSLRSIGAKGSIHWKFVWQRLHTTEGQPPSLKIGTPQLGQGAVCAIFHRLDRRLCLRCTG